MSMILPLIFGYILGSIPFGLVITRALGAGDLRKVGSGNIGATNVLRTGRKGAALATLLLDGGKGAAAVVLGALLFDQSALAGLGAFLGHLFPVWLRFRGGKGVATFIGVILALGFVAGLATCASWLVTAILTRISSASALVASTLAPVWLALFGQPQAAGVALIMTALIWVKHTSNIRRLLSGTEPKIGKS